MTTPLKVAVIGAGIVGTSTALWLKRDGHEVTVFDRIEPGDPKQTSYGNAGLLARSSVIPVPTPGLVKAVPKMLFGTDGPLFLKWRYLPKLLPWLVPFLRGANEAAVRRTAAALSDILGDAVDQHAAIARGTDAEQYITKGRYTFLYKDRAYFEKEALSFAIRAEHGFTWDEMDRDALLQVDPNLGPAYTFGAAVHDHGWITNPGAYTAALFDAFRTLGGTFRQAEVDDIASGETSAQVIAGGETHRFDRLVLASGAWSRKLAERLGHHVALETERGYHLMLKNPSVRPPCPYMIGDAKFGLTPMAEGVRAAGLVEFGGLDAAPSTKPLDLFRRTLRRVYPGMEWEGEDTWMGHRPSTTDSLPLIGESTRAKGIYFAFGAQHVGLTSGPKTGRLVADMIGGRRPNIDLSPFATDRFDTRADR